MATTPTGWLTTGSKLDCIQNLVRINSFHTLRLVSSNKLYESKTQKLTTNACTLSFEDSTKPKNSKCPFKDGQKTIRIFQWLRPGHWSNYCKKLAACPMVEDNTRNLCTVFFFKEGDYGRCLRCYESCSNKHHTNRTTCSAHWAAELKPQPECAGNLWYRTLSFIRIQVSCIYTVPTKPESVRFSGTNPLISIIQDWNGTNNGFSTQEVFTIDYSTDLCAWKILKLDDQIVDLQNWEIAAHIWRMRRTKATI